MRSDVIFLIIILSSQALVLNSKHTHSSRHTLNKKANGVAYNQLSAEQLVKFDLSLLNQDCKEKSEFLEALNTQLKVSQENLLKLNENFGILQEVQDKLFTIETSLTVNILLQHRRKSREDFSVPESEVYDGKASEIVKDLNANLLKLSQLSGSEKTDLIEKINNQIRNLRSELIFLQTNTGQIIEGLKNKIKELNELIACKNA